MELTDETREMLRTNDMSMVTYLRLRGHPVQEVFWDDSQCYWKFMVNQSLMNAYEEFVSGKALVDPREFSKIYATTKTELHSHNPRAAHR